MTPAFLVDGLTEQRFIQNICPGAPVKLINLNGNTVSSGAMAKRISSLIRMWKGRYYPLIIVVDREDRILSASDFCSELYELIKIEITNEEIIIGVADRMIENWMLADSLLWPAANLKHNVDGFSGVSVINKHMNSYSKSSIGPIILKKSRASQIKARSSSFKDFYEKVSHFDCYWLRQ